MEFMFEWEADGDRFSFEDSDRFEDDSLCSWISEPESLCNNWRGWRKPNCSTSGATAGTGSTQSAATSTQASASNRDNRSNGTCVGLVIFSVKIHVKLSHDSLFGLVWRIVIHEGVGSGEGLPLHRK